MASRFGRIELRARISGRVEPGVVYTTFHHATTKANTVTSDLSDWATNCPEYKVTAVQVVRIAAPTDRAQAASQGRPAAAPAVAPAAAGTQATTRA
jgi:formate dehydrogenase major subunit